LIKETTRIKRISKNILGTGVGLAWAIIALLPITTNAADPAK